MFNQIKEYAVVKQIMEKNSEYIRIYDRNQRVKTVDCKVLHAMVADVLHCKTVMKVQEDEFIFIRRSLNMKQQKEKKKKTVDSGVVSDQHFLVS